MKITARIDYACRAILELSLHWPNHEPMQINTIARNQHIPIKFLTQILLNLKQLGYVNSTRGKNGGYLLAKSPRDIKLRQLIEYLGGMGVSAGENRQAETSEHIMDLIWEEIDSVVLKAMDKINFETISNRKRSRDKSFIFQI